MVELTLNFSSQESTFSMTEAAAGRIKELIDSEGRIDQALQIQVTPGGCAGFSYDMNFADISTAGRKIEKNGSVLIISEADMRLLDGGELDYVQSLMGSKFEVNNPNASSTCGCGKSWS
ncbi:MAG: HesB/IscA family protein [Candidatus Kariarchaeaceae archaeon]|jgi:iron-sulfur cluster assembly accessory protein